MVELFVWNWTLAFILDDSMEEESREVKCVTKNEKRDGRGEHSRVKVMEHTTEPVTNENVTRRRRRKKRMRTIWNNPPNDKGCHKYIVLY